MDTGALQERDLGERAGLGFVGKNSMLINTELGSGFFLGELLTTLPLPPHQPPAKGRGSCGRCQKCIVACPTSAIVEDRVRPSHHLATLTRVSVTRLKPQPWWVCSSRPVRSVAAY